MNAEVRDASKDDLESLIDIFGPPGVFNSREEATWFVKSFFNYHHIKVVEFNRKIIGVLIWRIIAGKHHGLTEINDLWINEKFRRRGLGERLLRASIDDMMNVFAKHGYPLRKVIVITGEDSEPARKLYEKVGFQPSGVLKDFYVQGENQIMYILTLSP